MRTAARPGLGTAASVALLIFMFLIAALFTFFLLASPKEPHVSTSNSQAITQSTNTSSSSLTTVITTTTSTSSPPTSTSETSQILTDTSIENGTSRITFPHDYAAIANNSLSLVNTDRARVGASPVSLSPVHSAQQHADSMLYFGYFSHWDTQGYKPYMRYTLLGGPGGMGENVAYEYFPSHFRNTSDIEQAIAKLESQMIYNDSACCQNGHRDNILQPLHNRVSLGIAYNESYVYFVEDFENYYIDFSQPVLSGSTVRLVGLSSANIGEISVYVFYDNLPQPLTAAELNQAPYQGSYDQGKFTGGVVPPCLTSCLTYPGNITVHAQTWSVSQRSVDIVFSLSPFIRNYGKGVYTVTMVERSTSPAILYGISIFMES